MSYPAKDGAWISATDVVRIDCSKCGVVMTTKWPQNDRETEKLVREHAFDKHGGSGL